MAFVEIDRDSAAAFFVNDIVGIVNTLNNLHGLLERTNARMQQMTNAQVEALYGVPGFGSNVKSNVADAFTVVDENVNLTKLRTQMG